MGDMHSRSTQTMNHTLGDKRPAHTNLSQAGSMSTTIPPQAHKRLRTTKQQPQSQIAPQSPHLYNSTPVDTILNHPEYGPLPQGVVDERELHRREIAFHTRYPGNRGYQIRDRSPEISAVRHRDESVSPRCLSLQPANENINAANPQDPRCSIVEISSSDEDNDIVLVDIHDESDLQGLTTDSTATQHTIPTHSVVAEERTQRQTPNHDPNTAMARDWQLLCADGATVSDTSSTASNDDGGVFIHSSPATRLRTQTSSNRPQNSERTSHERRQPAMAQLDGANDEQDPEGDFFVVSRLRRSIRRYRRAKFKTASLPAVPL